MEFLPDEMVLSVLSRVSNLDILRLRFVCKSWKKMVADIEPSIIQLQYYRSNLGENQVLVMADGKDLCFLDMAEKARATRKKLTSMGSRFEIIGSCDGILCLLSKQTHHPTILITNPFTNQKILLPKLDFITEKSPILACGFGYDPTTKLYKVVVVQASASLHLPRVMVYDGRSSNWRYIGMVRDYDFYSRYPEAFLNGRLHWITNEGIISFDLTNEKFRWMIPPLSCFCQSDHLIVINGCLGIIFRPPLYLDGFKMSLGIWIMKEYGWTYEVMKDIWARFEVLGEEADNGKILVECSSALLLINLKHENFKILKCRKLPGPATLHTATLNWILSLDSTCG